MLEVTSGLTAVCLFPSGDSTVIGMFLYSFYPCMLKAAFLSFCSGLHRSARKGPHALRPVSQQSPLVCPRHSASVWLNTDCSRPRRVEYWPLPFSTPLSSRRPVLLPVLVQKIAIATELFFSAKLYADQM